MLPRHVNGPSMVSPRLFVLDGIEPNQVMAYRLKFWRSTIKAAQRCHLRSGLKQPLIAAEIIAFDKKDESLNQGLSYI